MQDLPAPRRVGDLGVEQHAKERPLLVPHSRDGSVGAHRRHPEAGGGRGNLVSVARPHGGRGAGLEPREQTRRLPDRDLGAAVLALGGRRHLTARQLRQELHSITDAEDGSTEIQEFAVGRRGPRVEHGVGPPREHDALGVEAADELEVAALRRRVDLAVHVRFADAPRDQLRVLRAVIENEDPVHA